jgi:hypothetical protein
MSTSTKAKPIETPEGPTLAEALEVMEAARAQDRELTDAEGRLVGIVMARADRPAAMAIHEAGKLIEIAGQRRRAQETYAAADRVRERLNAFAATRPVEFAKLPPFLQLAWVLCERAGGRASVEGRQLARLLEDLSRGEPLQPPDCFMPAPKSPGQP